MDIPIDTPICRVCRSEATEDQPLFYPCRCSGSIKYIHQECLVEWLNHSKKKYCELCKHPFTFSPIYAPQMPSRIPFSVLILGSIKFAAKLVKRSLSFIFAAFLWGFLVPMVSAQIFRYYFGFSLQGLLNLAPLRLAVEFSSPEELQQYVFESAIYLLFDVVQGLLICGFTVFLGLGLLLTRELQTMIQPTTETPAQNQAGETASDIEDAPVAENENIRPTNVRFRSLANQPPVEVASTLNSTLAGRTPPPPQSPMADESSFSPRQSSIFSPQAQQLFSEIARLEEALNGTGSSEASTSSGNSGGYWLDRVHPKEYKKYVQRSNLQRQMMAASQGGSPDVPPADFTTAADDSFSFWSSPNFDDHLSNISATTTLRTNATAQTNSNFDSIRCRICSSTTCINRDHVIQASRLRFAAVAARNQALINESLEFGGFNTPSTSTSQTNQSPPAPVAENALTNSTNSETANNTDDTAPVRPGLVRRRQPAQPEQQPQPQQQQQQPQREEEDWRFNLDADSITLAEFFGFSAEGANPIELFQNAAIVTGCNALVMIVFLCIPCLFGSIILKEVSIWSALLSLPTASNVSGFTARLVVGYSALAFLLSFYHSLGKRLFKDAFHRSFLPALAFFGTFCKLVTLLCMEMVAFPVACGVLVDLLTLPLFPGSTLIGRLRQFTFLPVSWIAIHWALGAAFMLSFANYVSFLRSFCRPGLIYFLRNPADPDTHPLREMLERSFFDQVYRLAVSFAFYSFLTACSVGGAARIISSLPIAPLKVSFAEPIAEAPLVLLLHLCLRWLLTRLQPGLVLGKVYKSVAENVISSLGLSSYFLGKHPDNPGSAKLVAVPDFDRVYSRPAMKAIRTFRPASLNQTNKPPQSTIVYRPNMFALRCIAVVAVGFVICQLILAAAFSIPLTIGRILMPALENEIFILFAGAIPVIIGLSLLGGRGSLLVSRESMQKAVAFALSFIFAGLLWPIALGISFVLVTAPLLTVQPVLETALGTSDPINTFWTLQHEPLVHSIPIVFVTTCWSIGFPLLKICHMARNHLPLPQSALDALNSGPTVSNYTFVFKVALPITVSLAAFIVLPPFIPLVMTALLSSSPLNLDSILPMQRVIHLSILLTWLVWRLGSTLGNSLGQVLANIRDDAYLVGRRLHNLERDEVHHDEATQGQQPATVRERRIPATPIL